MNYEEATEALNLMLWPTFSAEALALLGYTPKSYWPLVIENETAPADEHWLRMTRRDLPSVLAGFGEGEVNKAARYDESGVYYIQLFHPQSDPLADTRILKLAKVAQDCFRGKNDPSGQLWIRDATIKTIPSEKTWFRVNVVIDFTYQEIRGA